MVDGRQGLLLGVLGIDARDADGHAQLERIGELDPLLIVTVVDTVVARHRTVVGVDGVGELGDGEIQVVEHLVPGRLLVVVGDGILAVGHLRIGQRALEVEHILHHGHAVQHRQRIVLALLLGVGLHLEIGGIELGVIPVDGPLVPVVVDVPGRIERRTRPAVRCGDVSAETGPEGSVPLVGVLFGRREAVLHLREELTDVERRRFVGVGVVFVEVAGTSG